MHAARTWTGERAVGGSFSLLGCRSEEACSHLARAAMSMPTWAIIVLCSFPAMSTILCLITLIVHRISGDTPEQVAPPSKTDAPESTTAGADEEAAVSNDPPPRAAALPPDTAMPSADEPPPPAKAEPAAPEVAAKAEPAAPEVTAPSMGKLPPLATGGGAAALPPLSSPDSKLPPLRQ